MIREVLDAAHNARSAAMPAAQGRDERGTMNGRPPPNFSGLLRAQHDAQERKHREIELLDRITRAERPALEAEAEGLGITHAGQNDAQLRRTLLTWHRLNDPA
jgi:hypothetical protein